VAGVTPALGPFVDMEKNQSLLAWRYQKAGVLLTSVGVKLSVTFEREPG
jgi:hypothetical protein